jgi:hypothetical protein
MMPQVVFTALIVGEKVIYNTHVNGDDWSTRQLQAFCYMSVYWYYLGYSIASFISPHRMMAPQEEANEHLNFKRMRPVYFFLVLLALFAFVCEIVVLSTPSNFPFGNTVWRACFLVTLSFYFFFESMLDACYVGGRSKVCDQFDCSYASALLVAVMRMGAIALTTIFLSIMSHRERSDDHLVVVGVSPGDDFEGDLAVTTWAISALTIWIEGMWTLFRLMCMSGYAEITKCKPQGPQAYAALSLSQQITV